MNDTVSSAVPPVPPPASTASPSASAPGSEAVATAAGQGDAAVDPVAALAADGAPPAPPPLAPPPQPARLPERSSAWLWGAGVVGALAVASLTVALLGQQKIRALEHELVRRQQDSQNQSVEARTLARQAQELAQAAESKVSLLEARVGEVSLQRSQFEDLVHQLSRSRDENVLADVDAAVRVAMQQSGLTGSVEPLVAALRQAEDRLARLNQPQVERVRRAVARDLDRVRAASVTDIPTLAARLDEVMRHIDDLPLVSQAERRGPPAQAKPAASGASGASSATGAAPGWWRQAWDQSRGVASHVWQEARSLVRITRIDQADALLVAPEQTWFVRENLKLRVLNARLALMSRQPDTAQNDLRAVQTGLERYFDRSTRRVQLASELVQQVASQARTLNLPRPDETLAALTAVQAGR